MNKISSLSIFFTFLVGVCVSLTSIAEVTSIIRLDCKSTCTETYCVSSVRPGQLTCKKTSYQECQDRCEKDDSFATENAAKGGLRKPACAQTRAICNSDCSGKPFCADHQNNNSKIEKCDSCHLDCLMTYNKCK